MDPLDPALQSTALTGVKPLLILAILLEEVVAVMEQVISILWITGGAGDYTFNSVKGNGGSTSDFLYDMRTPTPLILRLSPT